MKAEPRLQHAAAAALEYHLACVEACQHIRPAGTCKPAALTALQVQVHDAALVQVVQALGDVKQHAPAAAREWRNARNTGLRAAGARANVGAVQASGFENRTRRLMQVRQQRAERAI